MWYIQGGGIDDVSKRSRRHLGGLLAWKVLSPPVTGEEHIELVGRGIVVGGGGLETEDLLTGNTHHECS